MALLQVLISTFGADGLARVSEMQLPTVDNVSYLVSCQSIPVEIPDPLLRPDVCVKFTHTSGLSVNRNIALSLATAPYVLIADDDIDYNPEGLGYIISAFEEDNDLDIATFIVVQPQGGSYPTTKHDLWKYYRNYMPYSPEIALRTESIMKNGLSFNENFGVGAPEMICGEEDLFLLQAKKNGLKGAFHPTTIGRHNGVTSGYRLATMPGVLKAQGAVITLKHPFTFVLRLPLKAYRTGPHFFSNFRHLCSGAAYALAHRYLRYSNHKS